MFSAIAWSTQTRFDLQPSPTFSTFSEKTIKGNTFKEVIHMTTEYIYRERERERERGGERERVTSRLNTATVPLQTCQFGECRVAASTFKKDGLDRMRSERSSSTTLPCIGAITDSHSPVSPISCINICAHVKNPKHWQQYHFCVHTKNCTHW